MMDQTHIGYTYWQQPNMQKMPEVKYVSPDDIHKEIIVDHPLHVTSKNIIPKNISGNIFYEEDSAVSIDASHFSQSVSTNRHNVESIARPG